MDEINKLSFLYTTAYLDETDPVLNIAMDLAEKINNITEKYLGMLVKIALYNNNTRMLEYALIKKNVRALIVARPLDSMGRQAVIIDNIGDTMFIGGVSRFENIKIQN